MNGIDINEKEFAKLKFKSQNVVLFQNIRNIEQAIKQGNELFGKHMEEDKFNFLILRWGMIGLALLAGLVKYFNLL